MSARKCAACATKTTRPCWIYVISRADQPWAKIGITHQIGGRMATYRKRGIDVLAEYRREFCCDFAAGLIETIAHDLMETRSARSQGDWFCATVADSVAAIEAAVLSPKARDLL